MHLIHSGYFCSASSSPLLLGGAPDYGIDTVSELTCRSATGDDVDDDDDDDDVFSQVN